MRYLGLDYGNKTLGVSVSDETALIASNVKTIRYNNKDELIRELTKVISEYKVDELVLGLPLNLNGTESDRSRLTKEFGCELEKVFNMKVNYQDERLSTTEAEKMLINNKTRRKNRKKVIDSIAAVIILESFLDKIRGLNEK